MVGRLITAIIFLGLVYPSFGQDASHREQDNSSTNSRSKSGYADQERNLLLLIETLPSEMKTKLNLRGGIPHGNLEGDIPDYWGIYRIGADLIGDMPEIKSGAEVTIGVQDEGFDIKNATIKDRLQCDNLPELHPKLFFHGTHVVGTILGKGPFSVGGQCNLRAALCTYVDKKTAKDQSPTVHFQTNIIDNLEWLTSKTAAKIITASLKFGEDAGFGEAVKNLTSGKGILVINAAGNDGRYGSDYNGNLDREYTKFFGEDVVFVGATNPKGIRAGFSNHGDKLFLTAPGEDIFSLDARTVEQKKDKDNLKRIAIEVPGCGKIELAALRGTSMATPHVSGVAGIAESIAPKVFEKNLDGKEVFHNTNSSDLKTMLSSMSIDLGKAGHDRYYGDGMLNAYGTLSLAKLRTKMSQDDAIKELANESKSLASEGVAVLREGIHNKDLPAIKEASEKIRKAYFLDPNNIDRIKLAFLMEKHFGFQGEANALAIRLYMTTRDKKWLSELSLYKPEQLSWLEKEIQYELGEVPHYDATKGIPELLAKKDYDYRDIERVASTIRNEQQLKDLLNAEINSRNNLKDNAQVRSVIARIAHMGKADTALNIGKEWIENTLKNTANHILSNSGTASEKDLELVDLLHEKMGSRSGVTISNLQPILDEDYSSKRWHAESTFKRIDPEKFNQWKAKQSEIDLEKAIKTYTQAKSIEGAERSIYNINTFSQYAPSALEKHSETIAKWWDALSDEQKQSLIKNSEHVRFLAAANSPEINRGIMKVLENPGYYGLDPFAQALEAVTNKELAQGVLHNLEKRLLEKPLLWNNWDARGIGSLLRVNAEYLSKGLITEDEFLRVFFKTVEASHKRWWAHGNGYGFQKEEIQDTLDKMVRDERLLHFKSEESIEELLDKVQDLRLAQKYYLASRIQMALQNSLPGDDDQKNIDKFPASESLSIFFPLLKAYHSDDEELSELARKAMVYYGHTNPEFKDLLFKMVGKDQAPLLLTSETSKKLKVLRQDGTIEETKDESTVRRGPIIPAIATDGKKALDILNKAETTKGGLGPLERYYAVKVAFGDARDANRQVLLDELFRIYPTLPEFDDRLSLLVTIAPKIQEIPAEQKILLEEKLFRLLDEANDSQSAGVLAILKSKIGDKALKKLKALGTMGWDTAKKFRLQGFILQWEDEKKAQK